MYNTLPSTQNTKPIRSSTERRRVKKILAKIIVLSALIGAALLPVGIKKAQALTYNPGYTCYYRDVSGSCLSYQTSNPYLGLGYGNRKTYPFNTFFNASNTSYSPWGTHYWEDDDDDNDYWDEDDRYYKETRYYYDEDDDTVRPYRYQSHNRYYDADDDHYWYGNRYSENEYFEYEHTKVICDGRECATTQYRY